jgi:hypothetical protein
VASRSDANPAVSPVAGKTDAGSRMTWTGADNSDMETSSPKALNPIPQHACVQRPPNPAGPVSDSSDTVWHYLNDLAAATLTFTLFEVLTVGLST